MRTYTLDDLRKAFDAGYRLACSAEDASAQFKSQAYYHFREKTLNGLSADRCQACRERTQEDDV